MCHSKKSTPAASSRRCRATIARLFLVPHQRQRPPYFALIWKNNTTSRHKTGMSTMLAKDFLFTNSCLKASHFSWTQRSNYTGNGSKSITSFFPSYYYIKKKKNQLCGACGIDKQSNKKNPRGDDIATMWQ